MEFTVADAGRLAVDWLSWSAQLGHCPQRVVCLSVPSVGGDGLGPEALFANLAKSWPGATIDGAVHEDRIGATIARLAGLGDEEPHAAGPDERPESMLPYFERPREALTDLTSRPGRADRRLYMWIGLTLMALAVFVGVLGWQVNRSVGAAEAQLNDARKAKLDALKELDKQIPHISESREAENMLKASLARVRDQAKAIKPPRPVLKETLRVLKALEGVNGDERADDTLPPTLLTDLEITNFSCRATLSVPDAATGPAILEKLQKIPGVLDWQGSTPTMNTAPGGGRTYQLLALTWPDTDSGVPAPKGKKP